MDHEHSIFAEGVIVSLPTPVAIALASYADPSVERFGHKASLLKLWSACDAVELLARSLVLIGLSELQPRSTWKVFAARVRDRIERPTLGAWKSMLIEMIDQLPPKEQTILTELHDLRAPISEFFDGEKRRGVDKDEEIEISFSALRNRLAHGGGMHDVAAAALLDIWQDKIDAFFDRFDWLSEVSLFALSDTGDLLALRGCANTGEVLSSDAPRSKLAPHNDEIVASRAGRDVLLWPLLRYGLPRIAACESPPGNTVVEIYARRSSFEGFHYTPIGLASAHWSLSGADATARFQALFPPVEHHETWDAVSSFRAEIREAARECVGRRFELEKLLDLLRGSSRDEPSLLWISGRPGIGKSVLVAKVADLLLHAETIQPTARTCIVPYRFHRGDARCSREYFLMLASRTLSPPKHRDRAEPTAYTIDALRRALSALKPDAQCIFVLDGIDEIDELDPKFLKEVCLELIREFGAAGNIRWLMAGRDQSSIATDLDAKFKEAGAVSVFPGGLQPMSEEDVRALLLDQIGPARESLILNDRIERKELLRVRASDALTASLQAATVPEALRTKMAELGHRPSDGARCHRAPGATAGDPPGLEPRAASWLIDDMDGAMYRVTRVGDELVVWLETVRSSFIDSVVKKSDGLPLYVRYVVKDILEGRLRRLDGEEPLPEGMTGYYERLLTPYGIGTLQTLVTKVICLIAIAREPLTQSQILACIEDELSRKESAERWFPKVMLSLSSLLREENNPSSAEHSYGIYHHTLRKHLDENENIRASVDRARDWMSERSHIEGSLDEAGPFAGYVARYGAVHLIEGDMIVEAVNLLDHLKRDDEARRYVSLSYLSSITSRRVARALRDLIGDPQPRDLPDDERRLRKAQLQRMSPRALVNMVASTYETGVYEAVLRIVIEYNYDEWWLADKEGIRREILNPYDIVARHTLGEALSDIFLENETLHPALLSELTSMTLDAGSDINAREAAGYALEEIFLERPELMKDHLNIIEQWERSDNYVERMILGELLVRSAHACRELGHDEDFDARREPEVASLIHHERFWKPIWQYNEIDIDDFRILTRQACIQSADERWAQCEREHEVTAALRARLKCEKYVADQSGPGCPLLALLEKFDFLGPNDPAISRSFSALKAAMEEGGEAARIARDVIKLLFSHSLWAVAEGATTLVTDLVDDDLGNLRLIGSLLDEEDAYWRVRYGAIDASFNVRDRDQYQLLRRALKENFGHPNCRVRGICFDDFFAWVRLAAEADRMAILNEFEPQLRHALTHANDCWELEYIYLLFSFLHEKQPGFSAQGWLGKDARYTHYLGDSEDTAFYLLDREAFLKRIDRIRRAEC